MVYLPCRFTRDWAVLPARIISILHLLGCFSLQPLPLPNTWLKTRTWTVTDAALRLPRQKGRWRQDRFILSFGGRANKRGGAILRALCRRRSPGGGSVALRAAKPCKLAFVRPFPLPAANAGGRQFSRQTLLSIRLIFLRILYLANATLCTRFTHCAAPPSVGADGEPVSANHPTNFTYFRACTAFRGRSAPHGNALHGARRCYLCLFCAALLLLPATTTSTLFFSSPLFSVAVCTSFTVIFCTRGRAWWVRTSFYARRFLAT